MSSDDYLKGLEAGRQAAQEESGKSGVDDVVDHFTNTGRFGGQTGSSEFREGFKDGLEEGRQARRDH